jgi:hypothetical protein
VGTPLVLRIALIYLDLGLDRVVKVPDSRNIAEKKAGGFIAAQEVDR